MRKEIGRFRHDRVYSGRLSHYAGTITPRNSEDARAFYVTGPTTGGRIGPLMSFWNAAAALTWARRASEVGR